MEVTKGNLHTVVDGLSSTWPTEVKTNDESLHYIPFVK